MSDFATLADRARSRPADAVAQEVDRAPGKQTLVGAAYGPVGNELVDRGPYCGHAANDKRCILSAGQRGWLIGEFWHIDDST